ncbi:MAG: SdpI family protein [Solobacterium sp.]|nr:SdpI family protein [Solobacterium sp.]
MNEKKRLIFITTLICLIPAFVGILMWSRLPEQIPIHYNAQGQIDLYAGKPIAVFGIPLLITALHLLCAFLIFRNSDTSKTSPKVLRLILWIFPIISLLAAVLTYSAVFGTSMDLSLIVNVFLGLLLVSIGCYLPECPQNQSIGFRIPWTLADEANWKQTHQFAGPLWIAGGTAMILMAFLGITSTNFLVFVLLLIVVVPSIYSYKLYKKTH